MPWVPIENVGQYGIMRGQLPHTFPPNAWTQGSQNVSFEENYAFKAWGESVATSPVFDVYAIYPAFTATARPYVLLGLAKARVISAGSETDITRVSGDYTGTAVRVWSACMLDRAFIATNGVDLPQYWDGSVLSPMIDLPNWPAGYLTQVMCSFKNYLVALKFTDNLGRTHGRTIKTSHPADPGSVPLSWDHTDPTKDAAEIPLPGGEDHIIGGLELGDTFMVYTDQKAYGMTLSGTNSIFNIRKIFDFGAVNFLSYTSIKNRRMHVVWTRNDVVVHDGVTVTSIANAELRTTLGNLVDDPSGRHVARAVAFDRQREVWFTGGSNALQEVCYTWNWETGAWGHRFMPQSSFVAPMPYDPYAFALADRPYDGLLISSPTQDRIFKVVKGGLHLFGASQSAFSSTLARTHLTVAGYENGKVLTDPSVVKMVKGIRPRIAGLSGNVIKITCNAQMDLNGAPSVSSGPHDFVIGTTHLVEPNGVTGRFVSVYIEDLDITDARWILHGYDIEVIPLGGF